MNVKNQTRKRPVDDIRELELIPIPKLNGYYITAEGKVISVMELTPYVDQDGYKRVHVFQNGKHKRPGLHVLLAKTFLPDPDHNQNEVRHLDGNKNNIDLSNLAWGTRQENAKDKVKHGSARGEKNPKAKLTELDVSIIKKRLLTERICDVYLDYPHIGKSTLDAIKSGKNWGYVKPKQD